MKNICVLVLISIIALAQAWTKEDIEHFKKYKSECIAETKVKEDLVEQLGKGHYAGTANDVKAYTKCFYEKANFMDDHGNIHVDVMKKTADGDEHKDDMLEVIDHCIKLDDPDAATKSYLLYKCYWEGASKVYHS